MNKDILQGMWKQVRGDIKTKWGKLTDDELDQVAGHRDKLLGLIQQKYGENREAAETELNKLLTKIEKTVH
jgi:uncharacterized protein YjbJ (UPF0337 family)